MNLSVFDKRPQTRGAHYSSVRGRTQTLFDLAPCRQPYRLSRWQKASASLVEGKAVSENVEHHNEIVGTHAKKLLEEVIEEELASD